MDALREYAATAVKFMPIRSDALQRLLIADLVGEPVTRESMRRLRDDLSDLEARMDEMESTAHLLPHREKYLLLAMGHMRGLLELHEKLVDDVERELAAE